MTAAASFQPGYALSGSQAAAAAAPDPAEYFDDSDGAYTVVEPDPFADQGTVSARRPSLRAELGSAPATPLTGGAGLLRPALPPLPAPAQLAELLPGGLRRGSTIAVSGSVSLLLTLLGAASGQGAWTALVGMPTISAEAAAEAGIDLARLAMVTPADGGWTGAGWTTAVGALLDAVDVVVARPGAIGAGPGVTTGDSRRLTARARSKDAVLVLFGQSGQPWPAVELKLSAEHAGWSGIGDGYGRLTRRRLVVTATGRGRSSRPRSAELLL
ncbi:MAG TPA: hypothetical protein VFD94_03320 [Jatrophihabitans sp.]|jgi:hypothetical protein|nr:hypothetical protein [Jatrophihabitans sp.]